MKIMLVEDHADVARSTIMLLKLLGHEVRHATTGANAIEIAQKFPADIMFIDIGLPDISGFEVAEKIRSSPEHEKTILVALTGYDCEERANRSGFSHYCKKPMDVDNINQFMPKKSTT